jgi:hypothetical protein
MSNFLISLTFKIIRKYFSYQVFFKLIIPSPKIILFQLIFFILIFKLYLIIPSLDFSFAIAFESIQFEHRYIFYMQYLI